MDKQYLGGSRRVLLGIFSRVQSQIVYQQSIWKLDGNLCVALIVMIWDGFVQGFIEGRYVALAEGEDVTASMDIVEAESADAAASLAAAAEAEAKTA